MSDTDRMSELPEKKPATCSGCASCPKRVDAPQIEVQMEGEKKESLPSLGDF